MHQPLTFAVLCAADPAQQCHQLATVTNTKTKCVAAVTELIKLLSDAIVEADSGSPSYQEIS